MYRRRGEFFGNQLDEAIRAPQGLLALIFSISLPLVTLGIQLNLFREEL
jgi:hypothetical protein